MPKRAKAAFRKELLALRRGLAVDVRAWLSGGIRAHLAKHAKDHGIGRVFAYSPLHGEPDLMGLAAETAFSFHLPVMHEAERRLSFHAWRPGEPLAPNRFGILEPPASSASVEPAAGDLIAVPAVALDRGGHRLGYGGGYYDRLLSRVEALPVGVVYDLFLLERLPAEDHDRRLPYAVTESGVIALAALKSQP